MSERHKPHHSKENPPLSLQDLRDLARAVLGVEFMTDNQGQRMDFWEIVDQPTSVWVRDTDGQMRGKAVEDHLRGGYYVYGRGVREQLGLLRAQRDEDGRIKSTSARALTGQDGELPSPPEHT